MAGSSRLSPAVDFLENSAYTVFLGRGPARASAMFTSVLFREVPKVVAEGMGAAAFRHGLREMIKPAHRVVIFAPQSPSQPMLVRLAKDLIDIDIPVIMISNSNIDLGVRKKFLLIKTAPQPELWSPLVDMVPHAADRIPAGKALRFRARETDYLHIRHERRVVVHEQQAHRDRHRHRRQFHQNWVGGRRW